MHLFQCGSEIKFETMKKQRKNVHLFTKKCTRAMTSNDRIALYHCQASLFNPIRRYPMLATMKLDRSMKPKYILAVPRFYVKFLGFIFASR